MSGPTNGSSSPSCNSGVCVAPGATALSRMFAPAQSLGGRVTSDPARQRELGDGVRAERLALPRERPRRGLVACEARFDERDRDPGLRGGRVGADGDRRGLCAGREHVAEPGEQLDGAEVVHRDQQ